MSRIVFSTIAPVNVETDPVTGEVTILVSLADMDLPGGLDLLAVNALLVEHPTVTVKRRPQIDSEGPCCAGIIGPCPCSCHGE
jgi:hypothetical protein